MSAHPVTGHDLAAQLQRLGWREAAAALERQEEKNDPRPFRERLSELLAAQEGGRGTRWLNRELRNAGVYGSDATLSAVRYNRQRGLSPATVEGLADMGWIRRQQNLIVLGAAGRGKTWLATAFTTDAIRLGHPARFFGLRRFLDSRGAAAAQGDLTTWAKGVAAAKLIVLDGFGSLTLKEGERDCIQEVVEARHRKASFLVTSPLPVDEWEAWLGGGPIAAGIVDRLTGRAHTIDLRGPSLRQGPAEPGAPAEEGTGGKGRKGPPPG